MIKKIRKHIGTVLASIGMVVIVILTFGDIGQLFTDQYWANVGGNLSAIGALSIGLVLVQFVIKQGVKEQALSTGLNTEKTQAKYTEHSDIMARCTPKIIYLPHFLIARNVRITKMRKVEFWTDNGYLSERDFLQTAPKRLLRKYRTIKTNITADSIKWTTAEIVYTKNGRIEKLWEYRKRRTITGFIQSTVVMCATTLITGGMFLDTAPIPFWQKLIKLITYVVTIAITSIMGVIKNYEKGAFSVPSELDEINGIWREFELWEVPQSVKDEIEKEGRASESKEISVNCGTNLQKEPQKI